MRVLIISAVFWPDTTAVSQHLTDLAEGLTQRGHQVTVISSSRQYEAPERRFSTRENYKGISIVRIWQTGCGKRFIVGRVLDFFSFNINLFFTLMRVRKKDQDAVIGLTAPPLISFIGEIAARLKGMKFVYWAMDLQPELSIAAGYVRRGSVPAKVLTYLGDFVYKRADRIVALDCYMAQHIVRRGARVSQVCVIPVWPVMAEVYDGARVENPFRKQHNLGDRIVVMYSGNHSVVHPLDTILQAAWRLRDDPRFVFVFIGGGVRKTDVTDFMTRHHLENVVQLAYEPRDRIHLSLGAADLHLVVLGNGCTGYTHPNKVYGAMFIGRPVLYIGPRPSHVADLLSVCRGNIEVQHGECDLLVENLKTFAGLPDAERISIGRSNQQYARAHFARELLLGKLITTIESVMSST